LPRAPTSAFCCREARLFTTTPDGGDLRRFGDFMVPGAAYPDVSPDGKKVAVEWNVREGGFGADWRLDVSVLDADGSHERFLTEPFPRPFYSGEDPAWAPDSRHIALTLGLCPYVGCEPSLRSVVVYDTEDPKSAPAFIGYGGEATFGR
jgi:Tol biopolymer transport system component